MKTLLVTGGLGFIGSNLIELLLKNNYKVINIDKVSYSSNFYNTKDFRDNKNYKFIKCDINNQSKISKILNRYKPACIFNLAAETHVDRSIDNAKHFISSNITGVFSLLQVCKNYIKKNKKFKFIHISTDEVYGDKIKGKSKENDPYKPSSPYAASKASSDHLVYSYIRTFNFPGIITNCSNNYGPKQHPEKLIPKIIYNIFNNRNLPIYGRGINEREWIYVKDHCEALLKIYKRGSIGSFYNIGSSNILKNKLLVLKLVKLAKTKIKIGKNVKIKFVKDRPGHDTRYSLDSSKIMNSLKWKPKTNINKGLYETFEWYKNNYKYFTKLNKKDILRRLGIKR
jgi:dTDP-glucose 4,6-dehydratase